MKPRPHPPARPHGELTEVLPGLFFVTGTVSMGPGIRFSQAMTVVKSAEKLVIVNSVRLGEQGLAALERLGKVTDVIRLAANHGAGDPFYKERYGARVWAAKGAPYMPGFDPKKPPYFEPDERFDAQTQLPIDGARVHLFGSNPPEALLHLPLHGGTVISGDALQNWAEADRYFSFLGKLMMRVGGFIKPANIGPGWLKQCRPPSADLLAVLALPAFENVFPAHGTPVLGGAQQKYRPALELAAQG